MKCFYIVNNKVYKGLGVTIPYGQKTPALIVGGNPVGVVPLKRMTVSDVRIVKEAVIKQRRGKFIIQEANEPSPGTILHIHGVKDFRPVRNCLVIEYAQESVLFALFNEGKAYVTIGQSEFTFVNRGNKVILDLVSPEGILFAQDLHKICTNGGVL